MAIRDFVLIVIAGAAIGSFLPGDGGPETAREYSIQSEQQVRPSDVSWRQEVALKRSGDGHFYADVEVDGHVLRFLVDTGATGIALTGEDARTLGLGWNENELEPVGRGANGEVYGKRVTLHHLKLGDKEGWELEAAIIPQGLDVSLLGQSFLAQVSQVKIANDEMVLR